MKEFGSLVASHIVTLILEIVMRQILGWLNVNVYVTTIIVAVLVVIGNYVLSKLVVFRKKK